MLHVFNESKVVSSNEYLWSKPLSNLNSNFSSLVFTLCFHRFVTESYIDVWFYLNHVKSKYWKYRKTLCSEVNFYSAPEIPKWIKEWLVLHVVLKNTLQLQDLNTNAKNTCSKGQKLSQHGTLTLNNRCNFIGIDYHFHMCRMKLDIYKICSNFKYKQ